MDNEILQFVLARLEKLDEKQDANHISVMQELSRQADNLEANNRSLAEHMRRTDLLETNQKNLENRVEPIEQEFNRKKIIRDFLTSRWGTLTKIVGLAATICGALYSLAKVWPGLF